MRSDTLLEKAGFVVGLIIGASVTLAALGLAIGTLVRIWRWAL